ncbi:MAG: aldolase/citrate lyase family protein [Pseudomonadota bacterium]
MADGQDAFAAALGRDGVALAAWCGIGSSLVVETAAACGYDLVLIDQQHGFGGQAELLAGLTGARAGGLPAAVRVAWNEEALVSRALDAGAHAIVCPMINTVSQAQALVHAAKYPPLGGRSWGPYRASIVMEGEMLDVGNVRTRTFAQIETAEALGNLDAILAVDGLDGVVVGPNDLAISMRGDRDIEAPEVLEAIDRIRVATRKVGKIGWIFANTPEYARPLIKADWDIVTISTDLVRLRTAMSDVVAEARAVV